MLGADLLDEWQSDELIPAGSSASRLRDFPQFEKLVLRVRPEWIVLAAAYTDVDGCEHNPQLAVRRKIKPGLRMSPEPPDWRRPASFFVSIDMCSRQSTRPYETRTRSRVECLRSF